MFAVRLSCSIYWVVLTVLLLVPHPARLVGAQAASLSGGGRGVHFVFFLVLAALVYASRWPVRRTTWLAVLIVYAVTTEGLQWFVPHRHVELLDLLENLLGVLAGMTVWPAQRKNLLIARPVRRLSLEPLTVPGPDSTGGDS